MLINVCIVDIKTWLLIVTRVQGCVTGIANLPIDFYLDFWYNWKFTLILFIIYFTIYISEVDWTLYLRTLHFLDPLCPFFFCFFISLLAAFSCSRVSDYVYTNLFFNISLVPLALSFHFPMTLSINSSRSSAIESCTWRCSIDFANRELYRCI